jgi:hypothetical protein
MLELLKSVEEARKRHRDEDNLSPGCDQIAPAERPQTIDAFPPARETPMKRISVHVSTAPHPTAFALGGLVCLLDARPSLTVPATPVARAQSPIQYAQQTIVRATKPSSAKWKGRNKQETRFLTLGGKLVSDFSSYLRIKGRNSRKILSNTYAAPRLLSTPHAPATMVEPSALTPTEPPRLSPPAPPEWVSVAEGVEVVAQPLPGLIKTYAAPVELLTPYAPATMVKPFELTATNLPSLSFAALLELASVTVGVPVVAQLLPDLTKTYAAPL